MWQAATAEGTRTSLIDDVQYAMIHVLSVSAKQQNDNHNTISRTHLAPKLLLQHQQQQVQLPMQRLTWVLHCTAGHVRHPCPVLRHLHGHSAAHDQQKMLGDVWTS
jgi:hypothetical protein